MTLTTRLAATLFAGAIVAGCAGDADRRGDDAAAPGTAAGPRAAAGAPSQAQSRILFEFDSNALDREDIKVLERWAAHLAANPSAQVTLEGHCDERGTTEYNVALGERRAIAVRDWLTGAGVGARQIRVISYGEERPADAGHNERAWRKNRRVEIVAKP